MISSAKEDTLKSWEAGRLGFPPAERVLDFSGSSSSALGRQIPDGGYVPPGAAAWLESSSNGSSYESSPIEGNGQTVDVRADQPQHWGGEALEVPAQRGQGEDIFAVLHDRFLEKYYAL